MSNIGQQYTFWNLINEYKIVVPKIQRDYVQGRENDTVKKNREEFVEELIDSLAGGRPMSLNFVYGTIQNGNELFRSMGSSGSPRSFYCIYMCLQKKGIRQQ